MAEENKLDPGYRLKHVPTVLNASDKAWLCKLAKIVIMYALPKIDGMFDLANYTEAVNEINKLEHE